MAAEQATMREGIDMTPLIALPPEVAAPTRVAATMVVYMRPPRTGEPTEELVGSDYWPDGIDYDRWAPIAQPSPVGAFADPLDFLDLPED